MASVSKTFTSALILALCDEGKLRLGTSVASILPALHLDPKITVRQLLDHTSGLRDFFLDARIDKALQSARGRVWTAAQVAQVRRATAVLQARRGASTTRTRTTCCSGWSPSRSAASRWPSSCARGSSGRSGSTHTYEQIGEQPAGPVAHGYRYAQAGLAAKAIDLSDGSPMMPFTSVVTAAGAAGSVASTPEDLVHWAKALYSGSVLAPMTRVGMLVDVAATGARKATLPYGLGVQSVDIAGRRALGHTGRLLGFRSIVRWLPGGAASRSPCSRTRAGRIRRPIADRCCASRWRRPRRRRSARGPGTVRGPRDEPRPRLLRPVSPVRPDAAAGTTGWVARGRATGSLAARFARTRCPSESMPTPLGGSSAGPWRVPGTCGPRSSTPPS